MNLPLVAVAHLRLESFLILLKLVFFFFLYSILLRMPKKIIVPPTSANGRNGSGVKIPIAINKPPSAYTTTSCANNSLKIPSVTVSGERQIHALR